MIQYQHYQNVAMIILSDWASLALQHTTRRHDKGMSLAAVELLKHGYTNSDEGLKVVIRATNEAVVQSQFISPPLPPW